MEAASRCLFALAVAVGIAEGETAVALGLAAAPILSLAAVPPALARRIGPPWPSPSLTPACWTPPPATSPPPGAGVHARGYRLRGARLITLREQTFLNAGRLLIEATRGSVERLCGPRVPRCDRPRPAGAFQAAQASILPDLTRLRAGGETDLFRRSVNLTLAASIGFRPAWRWWARLSDCSSWTSSSAARPSTSGWAWCWSRWGP